MGWLKTLKITLQLAKRLFTFWATLSGDSKHRQVLSHGTKRMCTKRALPEGKAFFQPPEAAVFSERLSFLTPIAGVGWRAEGGREAGWQLKSCNFSTGFLRKPGLMGNLGADKTETQSLSWALVSCWVTWTHTHPILAPLLVWLISSTQRRNKGSLDKALTFTAKEDGNSSDSENFWGQTPPNLFSHEVLSLLALGPVWVSFQCFG